MPESWWNLSSCQLMLVSRLAPVIVNTEELELCGAVLPELKWRSWQQTSLLLRGRRVGQYCPNSEISVFVTFFFSQHAPAAPRKMAVAREA